MGIYTKNGSFYQRSCLQVFVAFVVTLPSSISSPLPQWSSEKVNNNLERINVTNKENTHTCRGKQQFHINISDGTCILGRVNLVFLVSIEVKWANLNGFVLLSEKGKKLEVLKSQNQHKL